MNIKGNSVALHVGSKVDQLQLVPLGGDTGPRREQHGTQIFCHLKIAHVTQK
jgi:hypothetical protein